MIVYRISKAKYATRAFSGEGGLESPGRWRRKGQPIVYTASTLSLAALEYFVHLGRTDSKIAFVAVHAIIPDDVAMEVVGAASLPKDWNSSPPIDATMDLGTRWCRDLRGVAIKVPSALVQGEFNFLLNPRHPDFKLVKISTPERFSLI
ncbi:MAG: RES family NAD+ phosphorylase [Acidobacteriota bacterium]